MANIINTGPNDTKKSTPRKRTRSKTALQVAGGLAIVLVLILAWMLISGRLVVMAKQPGEKVEVSYAVVCDEKIVDRYNRASKFEQRDGSEMPVQDTDELKKLSQDIASKKGSVNDATCQTILFWAALADKDYDAASSAYARISELHSEDRFANNDLNNNMQLSTYLSLISSINPDRPETEEGRGQ